MKITKFGHCCLLIEENGLKILTDPGDYTTEQNLVTGIDIILITHEHGDHLHIPSLKAVLQNNPQAKIITNHSVGLLLDKERVPYVVVENGQSATEKGVLVEGVGIKHHLIHPIIPIIDNTGYFIANRFFYPGDALTVPNKPVEILAFPITAPWLDIMEALDYVQQVKPQSCFPVHDGNLKAVGHAYKVIPDKVLTPLGIRYLLPNLSEEMEF
ncbi:MAG: MBL fold metallo-hydrolase [Patescibacteria group bacterium]